MLRDGINLESERGNSVSDATNPAALVEHAERWMKKCSWMQVSTDFCHSYTQTKEVFLPYPCYEVNTFCKSVSLPLWGVGFLLLRADPSLAPLHA